MSVLLYSYKKADSKETEVISPLPLKMKPNVSQEPQNVNQLLDKNEENGVLQKTSESIENCCPRVNNAEECVDKMYLDILRKKLSVAPSVLPQEEKIKKVSVYNLK